ncbi:four-helix bundle copper-binding protein [Allopusillimonas soli]|nr:four-helix bundle copper-binding protein [Allopusillimonas soli]
MNAIPVNQKQCIESCLTCYSTCLSSAMNHCLEAGGAHLDPSHFRIMMACVEICRTAAHFMLIGTGQHKQTCAICSQVCRDCAASCESLEGMEECANACRECAEHCAQMAA